MRVEYSLSTIQYGTHKDRHALMECLALAFSFSRSICWAARPCHHKDGRAFRVSGTGFQAECFGQRNAPPVTWTNEAYCLCPGCRGALPVRHWVQTLVTSPSASVRDL